MKALLILASFSLLISGCSVYRSEGRKQFESEAPGKISSASFELVACKNLNPLEKWFNQEFPQANYELVLSQDDLEIWSRRYHKQIEVRAFQKSSWGSRACTYNFASEKTWLGYKTQFIQELENNIMPLE